METQLDGPIKILQLKRILGMNSQYKFATMIGESTLVYMNQKHLIMQNIKNRIQEIIWSNRQCLQLQLISYLSDNAGCLMIIIICKSKQKRNAILFQSNPQKSRNILKKRVFQLEQISCLVPINLIKLLNNGIQFVVSYTENNSSNTIITFYDAFTGKALHSHIVKFDIVGISQLQFQENHYFCLESSQSIQFMDSQTNFLKQVFNLPLQPLQSIISSTSMYNGNKSYIGFYLTNFGYLFCVKIQINHISLSYKVRINEQVSSQSSMALTQNKLLIAFPNTPLISILAFSSIDHTKYKLIRKPLNEDLTNVKGILSANFSDDGSNCSLIFNKYDGSIQVICLDSVSFIIDNHNLQNYEYSFTKCGFLGQAKCISISSLNQKIFILNNQKMIYAYQMSDTILQPKNAIIWSKQFKQQPLKIQAHPCCFTILVIFFNELCIFPYNNYQLLPCLVSIKMAKYFSACFSPMGNQILLGGMGYIQYLSYYSLQVVKKVSFPPPKKIIDITFFNRWDILLNMNNQYLTILQQSGQIITMHFSQIMGSLVYYDAMHDLVIIAFQKSLVVKKRNGQQIAKTDLELTGIKMCLQFQTLFLGSKDGHLFLLQWAQDHLSLQSYQKIALCNSAIKFIQTSMDFKHLYIISDEGTIFIFELVQNQTIKIKKHISMTLLQKTQRTNYLAGKMLRSLQQNLERNDIQEKLGTMITQNSSTYPIDKQHYRKVQQKRYVRTTIIVQNNMKSELRAFEIENGVNTIYKLPLLRQRLLQQKKKFQERIREETNNHFKQQVRLGQLRNLLQQQLNQIILDHQDKIKQLKELHLIQLTSQQQQFIKKIQSGSKVEQECLQELEYTKYKNNLDMMDAYQNYISNKNTLTEELNSICKSLWQHNQSILGQNRQLLTKIQHYQTKNKEIFAQQNKLAKQLIYVLKHQELATKQRQQLSEQIIQTNKKSDNIILENKQRQAQVKTENIQANILSMEFEQQQQKYSEIHQQIQSLQAKYHQLEDLLAKQLEKRKCTDHKLCQCQQKIKILKKKKKALQDRRVIIKIKLQKNIQKHPQTKIMLKQQQQEISPIKQRDLNSSEVIRWNGLKQTFTNQYKNFMVKIKEQNKRLTYKYNNLKQNSHELHVLLNHLKSQIQRQKTCSKKVQTIKLSLHKARKESSGISFFETQPEFNHRIKKPIKKGAKFCSLHEGHDKFTVENSYNI